MKTRVFTRSEHNPIISPLDLPFPGAAVLNPGATEDNDEVVLLLRVEDHAGCSNIHVARSKNGVTDWKIESEPILRYGEKDWRYEQWGCEDARVTHLAEEKRWYITYTAYSANGAA
ncbi:MAG: glycosidase, partial [Planctomycetota bacterium]